MWGTVNDDANEQARQAVIQRQLEELQPFGVTVKDDRLNVSLNADNPTDLGITIASSRELVNHYNVHLDYLTPLSQGHLRLLKCFPKLVSLKIHNQALDATKGSILGQVLTQHRSTLTALDFSAAQGFKLTDDGLIAIQQSMSVLPYLKVINLQDQQTLRENGFSTLWSILSHLISLKELILNNMELKTPREQPLSAILSKLTHLTSLDLAKNSFTGDFILSLKLLPTLTKLNLSHNEITGEKLRSLAKSTSKKRFKILDISHNQINDEGITLISMLPNLQIVNASYNNISDRGADEIIDLRNLTKLNICANRITARGMIRLAQETHIKNIIFFNQMPLGYLKALRTDPTFTVLDLTGCKIGIMEAQALGLALNGTLTTLNLENNNIRDEGVRALSMGNLSALTYLNVQNNGIEASGAQALAQNTMLLTLNLAKNKIGDPGAQAFRYNTILTSLNLEDTDVADEGAQALAQNTILTHLNLSGNKVGIVGIQDLAKNTIFRSLHLANNKFVLPEILTLVENIQKLNIDNIRYNREMSSRYNPYSCSGDYFMHWVGEAREQYNAKYGTNKERLNDLFFFMRNPSGDQYKRRYYQTITEINTCLKADAKVLAQIVLELYYSGIGAIRSYDDRDHDCQGSTVKHIIWMGQMMERFYPPQDLLIVAPHTPQVSGQALAQSYNNQLEALKKQPYNNKPLQQRLLPKEGLKITNVLPEVIQQLCCYAQDGNTKYQSLANAILNLHCTQIGDISAQIFAQNNTLTSLDLTNNKVGDVGAQALAQNAILISLDLENNNIGDEGAQGLAQNTILQNLNLKNNTNIGEAGKLALRNSPNTKIRTSF